MKNQNKKAVVVKNIIDVIADIAYGSASIFGMYQPKEPKRIKNRK